MSTVPDHVGGDPQLKLYLPGDGSTSEGQWTLSECFEGRLRLQLPGSAARNFEQIRESLRIWETLMHAPTMDEIHRDEALCEQFAERLERREWRGAVIKPATVRKHATEIQNVLNMAGQRTKQRPFAARMYVETPRVPRPAIVLDEVHDAFTMAEMAQVLATRPPRWPKRIGGAPPEIFWPALFAGTYLHGFRRQTSLDWRWDWLAEDELGWWVHVPAESDKKKKKRRYYLSAAALLVIKSLRPYSQRVYPWPHQASYLHTRWRQWLADAGLPEARRFGLHGLRKAFASQLAKINGLIVPHALGHTGRGRVGAVALDHYVTPEAYAQALERLPAPWLDLVRWDPQRLLF